MTYAELLELLNDLPKDDPVFEQEVRVLVDNELHDVEPTTTASNNMFFVPIFHD
jgi:hypothetical protein